MVEMDAPPAAALYAEALEVAQTEADAMIGDPTAVPLAGAQKDSLPRVQIDAAAASRVQNHVVSLDAAQRALVPSISSVGAEVMFRTQRAYNGIAVRATPEQVAELAKLPGVKAVRPMTPKYQTAFSDINYLGTQSFWTNANAGAGVHGDGVKVAVIDSGLDYVHANFGGPGTSPAAQGITDVGPVPNAYFPSAKVPYGFDFAGDDYAFPSTPKPDNNPLDSAENGHGTACASLVAGFGVNFGGGTYTGNYNNSTPFASMKIAPGFAPRAQLIPLRVFGKAGSTALVTQAIEYAMDPNNDGNFSDRVDIISMSLGSNNGSADDDSAVASSNAAAVGIVVVTSAGNAGDSFYITGSPGTATGALSTAASFNDQSGYIANATLLVKRPANLAGSRSFAVYGSPSPRAVHGSEGDIVEARPRVASTAVSGVDPYDPTPLQNASFMAGKVCLVDRGISSFYQKAAKCQNSGGLGMIIVNETQPGADPIVASLTPAPGGPAITIPVVMISKADGDALRGSALFDANGVPQNGARVQVFNEETVISRSGSTAGDTMPTYSSRGPRLNDNALKPDITAPAEVVGVAISFTGTGVGLFNGTSSACPHVSGSMALMKQLRPAWRQTELRALAINTATNDLFTSSARTTRHGVSRVGAGRLDNDKASRSEVIIFNSSDPELVSVSFGSVEVPADGSIQVTKNVTIRDKRTSGGPITYTGFIQMVTSVGDTNFSAPQSQVRLSPGQDVTFPLLLRATGNTLRHVRGGDVGNGQAVAGGTLGRQWLSEAAGYAVLTPPSSGAGNQPAIRIPIYATVKPVSAMRTTPAVVTLPGNTGTFEVQLSGVPINQTGAFPEAIVSLAKPLELQYISPNAGDANFSSLPHLIKYVGVTSDYSAQAANNRQPTRLTFAVDGFGDATVPSFVSADREIYIDLNFDEVDDFVIYWDSRRRTDIGSGTTHSNSYFPVLQNLRTGSGVYLPFYTNGFGGHQLDTNAFNNSVQLATVEASRLGYTGGGQSNFTYQVVTFGGDGSQIDETPRLRYDIARPGMEAISGSTITGGRIEPTFHHDIPQTITIRYNGANFQTNRSLGLMMVHMHNGRGNRTDVVRVQTPKVNDIDPNEGPVGSEVQITGENFTQDMSVHFSPGVRAETRVLSARTAVAVVPPGAVTGPVTVSNAFGAHTSQQVFTVTPPPEPTPTPSPSPIASPGRAGAAQKAQPRGGVFQN